MQDGDAFPHKISRPECFLLSIIFPSVILAVFTAQGLSFTLLTVIPELSFRLRRHPGRYTDKRYKKRTRILRHSPCPHGLFNFLEEVG